MAWKNLLMTIQDIRYISVRKYSFRSHVPRQNIVELVNEIEIMGMGDIDTNKILRIHMFKIYGDCMYVSLEKFHGFFKSLLR